MDNQDMHLNNHLLCMIKQMQTKQLLLEQTQVHLVVTNNIISYKKAISNIFLL